MSRKVLLLLSGGGCDSGGILSQTVRRPTSSKNKDDKDTQVDAACLCRNTSVGRAAISFIFVYYHVSKWPCALLLQSVPLL